MTNPGDDCYFFYYSTCSKGDSCPFRHCEAAMGNETVCSLWQEGRCFRSVCKFRHMEITKNRKEIPCYWEKQPAGCQKPHCAFFHQRPRCTEGLFAPLDKSVPRSEEQGQEEAATPPTAAPPTTANPQLRGFIKTESQELVPSPTHPPVVINPADDDEDEEDQISEEGEDARGGPSPRKHSKQGDSLNFGVSTLEEIRLRKALKASMKRAGCPPQGTQSPTNGEKENIVTFLQPQQSEGRRAQRCVAERLGGKAANEDVNGVEGLPLRRSLAERLGRVVDSEQPLKALKPVKERLGSFSALVGGAEVQTKTPDHIHIKTLEEIRREKALKCQKPSVGRAPAEPLPLRAPRGLRRAAPGKDVQTQQDSTSADVMEGKRKRPEQDAEPCADSKKVKHAASEGAEPAVEVKVKTLEEIRKEKAARTRPATPGETATCPDGQDNTTKRRAAPHGKKAATQNNVSMETGGTQKAAPVAAGGRETNNVKVKSFEEIMREKRLRRQEQQQEEEEEQAKSPAAGGASQDLTAPPAANNTSTMTVTAAARSSQKMKPSLKGHVTTSSSSPPAISPAPDSSQSRLRVPTHKRLSIKTKAASNSDKGSVTAAPVDQGSGQQEAESQHDRSAPSPAKKARPGEETPPSSQRRTSRRPADTKVRPKLNVKPSVMKPAPQLKPTQKNRAAEASAVAAVKPLTCSSSAQEEKQQEEEEQKEVHRDLQVLSSLTGQDTPSSTPSQTGTSSPPTLRGVHHTAQKVNPSPDPRTGTKEECPNTKSSVPKTPPQPRSRRASVANRVPSSSSNAASSSSSSVSMTAVDDFDKLINEFTDDHLEEDVDPSIGEDDLLQELSQMIDS